MANNLFEGDVHGRAIKAEYGTDKSGKPQCRAVLEITTEGERTGTHVQWSGNFKQDSIKYTRRDMLALGWEGKTIESFVGDVLAKKIIVPFQVRIAEWTDPKTGKLKKWLSAGSIGWEAPPLNKPTQDTTSQVDGWFASAADDDDLPF